ncbi:MAG: hypothetical protein ACM32O_04200 [Clostridia bacterium]
MMDDILDIVFTLIALAGKYWFVILGYIVYRMLGLEKKKGEKDKRKRRALPPLTPVENGGQPGRMTVGQKPNEPEVMYAEGDSEAEEPNREWEPIPQASVTRVTPSEPSEAGAIVPIFQDAAPIQTHVSTEPQRVVTREQVRDGMKWAIILSPPRSKAPFRQAHAGKRR